MNMNIVPSVPTYMSKGSIKSWIREFRNLGDNLLVTTYDIEDEALECYARKGYQPLHVMAKLKGFGAYDIIEEDE